MRGDKNLRLIKFRPGVRRLLVGWLDDSRYTSFSIVFQPYQDDVRVIIIGCMQGTSLTFENIFRHKRGSSPGSLDQ